MNNVLERIQEIGIVPVIKIEDVSKAVPLAKALSEGGIPCAEVTFRAAGADIAIKAISDAMPDMLVGAGTVLTTEQVDRAVAAGAKFIVSPGLNPKVVAYCNEIGVPITPGCSNASDIEQAIELGLEVVKFFPAEAVGGLKAIKALAAPYGNMKFIPTGGISAANLNEYLAFDKIIACGGSWMVNEKLINEGKFDEIKKLANEAVMTMLGFSLAHVGINCEDEEEAQNVAKAICGLFGFEYLPGNSAIFTGTAVEVMKSMGRGTKGHIGFRTKTTNRAYAYLKSRGVEFIDESITRKDGKIVVAYIKREIGGFAIHIVG
ncbi:MAG: bifunctional 4-hydroxy-2-oxoglutarate aldolase/2-dehydro-3-deoxy-phosphogluconate aldolase [Christensenellales bacterium]|jgi:2-dehydro-3-deoxyphosphogluconate aldolase/(4S)-4-hydroxy-2-oxoglutarate aldolase